jgi:hypothetical protein
MRIGYAADNGQNYTGIGTVMRQQGLMGTAPANMPDRCRASCNISANIRMARADAAKQELGVFPRVDR